MFFLDTKRVKAAQEHLPKQFHEETKHELARIVMAREVKVFMNYVDGSYFVTKSPCWSEDSSYILMNKEDIPLDDEVFVASLCSFFLNEYFPTMCPYTAEKMPVSFLVDFDELLSVQIENEVGTCLKFYNYRYLGNRLLTKVLSNEDLILLKSVKSVREKYAHLLK